MLAYRGPPYGPFRGRRTSRAPSEPVITHSRCAHLARAVSSCRDGRACGSLAGPALPQPFKSTAGRLRHGDSEEVRSTNGSADRCHRHRRAPHPRFVGSIQRPRQEAQPNPGGVVPDRRRAQTPARPHPQPGVDGAGLRRPRAGDLRGGHPGPGQRSHCRRDPRPRPNRPRRERSVRGTAFAVRGRRELPAAAGGRELPPAARDANCHRGQDRVRPPLLQHERPGLQHRVADVPAQSGRGAVGLQGGGVLRRRRRGPCGASGELLRSGPRRNWAGTDGAPLAGGAEGPPPAS